MCDLVERLDIKAGAIEMGEKIAFGSDTALMREAAKKIESMLDREERTKEAIKKAFGENPIGSDGFLLVSTAAYNLIVEEFNA